MGNLAILRSEGEAGRKNPLQHGSRSTEPSAGHKKKSSFENSRLNRLQVSLTFLDYKEEKDPPRLQPTLYCIVLILIERTLIRPLCTGLNGDMGLPGQTVHS
ncbi:hypothetical protein KIN20_008211 [Parelaphostrongylus tenuis]|uniref:Uncharacterized protein n=1 Tax=Parelaphostrongylus tenuis TaxID=148309 RepID=A0AAD5MQU6_PARTN|nr:hypothetical protein KIN20_008211 [Parelaphostrongylus tenuis]